MANWWNSASTNSFTRSLTSITGQLSNNLKDILTEASEEVYDPVAELNRARQHIEDLQLEKQALTDECVSLKNQCDELIMQKQAAEIKSDMLLADTRRAIEEKDNELKRLRENTSAVTWNTVNDINNTWTDILEDDQPELNEYIKFQRSIRELKDENSHLRDELANLRQSYKSQQKIEKSQPRREDEIVKIEQMYSEKLSQLRQEHDEKIQKLQKHIQELEDLNKNLQVENELHKTLEVQKEVNDVDKDLLSQELEQANDKLSWYNEKFKEYSDLQSNFTTLTQQHKQLENDLEKQEKTSLERFNQYESQIVTLQKEIEQLNLIKQNQEFEKQNNDRIDELNRFIDDERQRCDALAADNDSMLRLLEETRSQIIENENNFKRILDNKDRQVNQLNSQIGSLQDQIENEKNPQINDLEKTIDSQNKQITELHEEKVRLVSEIDHFAKLENEQKAKLIEDEENRLKEYHLREMLEKQLIELNEDLQTLENDKIELNQEIDQLKEQLTAKDRQIQMFENSLVTPGSPTTISSSPNTRTRSPSPQTFEHLLELEAQILQYEQQFRNLNSIYERFATLLPAEISSLDKDQLSLYDRFLNLFEQWSTYVDTLSITQQELESIKQLLIEKQEDLEKLQFDLDLTTTKLIELQEQEQEKQTSKSMSHYETKSFHENEENEEEIEHILELHPFAARAPSRQSLISSTPGEKQQLIAQNELLSSLLSEKERELISLQQAEKTREDLIKNLDTLKTNLQQMELDKEVKQAELNDIRNVLDEKLRENSSLKKEKMYFIEKLAEMERERQEQQSIISVTRKQSINEEDKIEPSTTPTTVQQENTEKIHTEEEYDKLRSEYDRLVEFSKRQHDESLSYYNEYTRILSLYNELNTKSSQLQIDYGSLQSLIQQKNEAYLQCQNELNNYQNLLYHEKKKCEELDLIRSTLIERDLKLQQLVDNETTLLLKQSELEREIKLMEQQNFELKSAEQSYVEHLQQTNTEQMTLELKRITHERDLTIVEKKQFENEIDSLRQEILQVKERERKLTNEIERLRTHLLQIEESYTADLVAAEDREKDLRNQIAQLDDSNRAQNELIQQLNTSGEQSKQVLVTELAALKHEHSKLETVNQNLTSQLQYQLKCSQNLQNVLEQFKREREQHIDEHLRQYQDSLREQTAIATRLTNENNEIRKRLAEYNEALSAANRLNEQIEKKDLLINALRNDIHDKEKQIQQYEYNLRDLQSTSGSRVEKQLVKNILLSYFHTPVDKRQEVIPLLGALVGFTQDEYKKAIDATSVHNSNTFRGTGWLTGWLGGQQAGGTNPINSARARTQSETPAYDPNKSFAELLIQYVDQQSTNNPAHPAVKFNTEEYLHRHDSLGHHFQRKPSLSASANPFVNTTHISLNNQQNPVVLSTLYSQQNVNTPKIPLPPSAEVLPSSSTTTDSASSSTILKDLLKD